jgi:hypothetical protein
VWKQSKGYQRTQRRKAEKERKLATHRKSLHGRKVHEMVAVGNTVILEKISYKAWQKQYGMSVGLRAPGMFVAHLRRTVASTGGTLIEVPTGRSKLSQFCHGCGRCVKKPLSQRWHHCACGVGPVQRDLYSAFLASILDQDHLIPSCAQTVIPWEASEARLRAAHERVVQRAKEGQTLPRSFGLARAGVRRPQSLSEPTQESAFLFRRGRLEAWKDHSEPPLLKLSKAANTRVFIVYNDRENPLFSPILTFEQKFNILVCIVVYGVPRWVRKQGLYAGPRNPNV